MRGREKHPNIFQKKKKGRVTGLNLFLPISSPGKGKKEKEGPMFTGK